MSGKTVFTTFETAKLCHVSPLSIINWVNAGRLPAFRTPGGHRRIRRDDLIRFMRENGIPLPDDLREGSGRPKVLVVDDEASIREVLSEHLTTRGTPFEALTASDGFEAGRAEGRASALEESAAALAAVERGWLEATACWEEDRWRIMDGCEASVVELAWCLAEKIVRRVANVDRTVVLAQIDEALAHVMRPTRVTVRIHSADRPVVEETMPEIAASFARMRA